MEARKRILITVIIIAGIVSLVFGGLGQSLAKDKPFPSKEINIYIGHSPGGSVDTGGRIICKVMERLLGKPVIPINKPGASSAIAVSHVAKSKPDGYTLVYGILPYPVQKIIEEPSLPYDADKLTFFGSKNRAYIFLVVKSDSPWQTYEEFIDHAKKNPIKFATIGTVSLEGSVQAHLAKAAGFKKLIQVPYAGGSKAARALLGGEVEAFTSCGSVMPYIRSKDLKFLVFFGPERNAMFPEIPAITEKEKGFSLFISATDYLAGPKDIPDYVAQKLTKTFKQAVDSEEVIAYFKKIAYVSKYLTPDEFTELWKREKKFYTEKSKEAGLIK